MSDLLWHCLYCPPERGWNAPSLTHCGDCGEIKPPVVSLTEAPDYLNQAPKKAAKQGKSGEKKVNRQPLYKNILWDVFTQEISFSIDIKPVAKERPRFGNGKAYTANDTIAFEKAVKEAAESAMGERPLMAGLLQISMELWQTDGRNRDIDNVLKACMDSLNTVIYKDDSYIVDIDRVRLYRHAKQNRVSITIREFGQTETKKGKAA
jgi:Holliday junction resolvase RusA-like endonuclease